MSQFSQADVKPSMIALHQIYVDRKTCICFLSNSFSPEIVQAMHISLCPAFSNNNYTVLKLTLVEKEYIHVVHMLLTLYQIYLGPVIC